MPASPVLDFNRWPRAVDLARRWVANGQTTAITCLTGTPQETVAVFHEGACDVAQTRPLPDQPIYLVASITKPIIALGALLLIEQGELSLGDRVVDFLPEFGKQGKYGVEIRHLLTHTSGLPDMLPENSALRSRHAPLEEFVRGTCEQPLAFPAGKGVQYQSMGFAILAAILEQISGQTCSGFLDEHVFRPLEMRDTALGAPDDWWEPGRRIEERLVEVRLTPEQTAATTWNWNSRYWRQLGAPWGGLLTTAEDLAKLARCLLNRGRSPAGTYVFSPATVQAATSNQLERQRDVPEVERRCRPWGLGWRLHWPAHSANFGDLLGPRSYGHWGATGTVMWIDPDRANYGIVLSSQPQEPGGYFLARMSNAIAAAWD